MSYYKKLPEEMKKAVNKAVIALARKCKPCLIIKGTKPEEMVMERKNIMDDYWMSTHGQQVMTKLVEYAYHRGVLDGIEKSQSRDLENVKRASFEVVIGVEAKLDVPDR